MARKSVRPNIRVHKLYMKLDGWTGTAVGVQLEEAHVLQLCRALLEGMEKSPSKLLDLTLYPKRKTPVFTITWVES